MDNTLNIVGNSIKSIISRMTTLPQAVEALNGIGISTKDLAGNVRPVGDIIEELAGKWNTLSDAERQNLSVKIAGTFQLSRFNAWMLNYKTAIDATSTSLSSYGSASREQEKYNQSLEARVNRLSTAWYGLAGALSETILYDGIVTVTKALESLVGVGTSAISSFVTLPLIFGGVGTGLFLLSSRLTTYTANLITSIATQKLATVSTTTLTGKMYALAGGVGSASTAFRTLLMATGVGAILVGVGVGITALTKVISENVQKQEEFEAQQKKNVDAITSNKQQVSQLISEYERLSNAKTSGNWNADQEKEYLDVQQKLGELFPSLISHIDSTGQSHLKNKEAIREEIKATEDLIKAQNRLTIENASEEFEKLNDELSGSWADSFSNYVYGSLESQIKQQKNILEAMYENNADEGAIAKAEFELKQLERQFQQTSESIKGKIFEVADAVSSLSIDSNLTNVLQEFIYSLDMSNLDSSQLESFAKEYGKIQNDLQKAINSGDTKLFNDNVTALNELASETKGFDEELNNLTITYDKNSKTIVKGTEVIKVNTEAMEESAEISKQMAEEFSNAIDSISYINGVLEDYQENNGLSASSMMKLIEKYPQLIGYIDDEGRLIEELENIRNKDVQIAKQQMVEKLSMNEDFYNNNLTALEKYFDEHFKFYDGDLKQFKTLAQAKADVEEQLIEQLADGWAMYYNTATQQFQVDNWAVGSEQGQAAVEANEQLQAFRDSWNEFTLDKVDLGLDSIGTSMDDLSESERKAKESTDALKESTDAYKLSLEKLNLELERMQAIQSKFPEYSNEYQDALESEIALQEQKLELMKSQEGSLKSMTSLSSSSVGSLANSASSLSGTNTEQQIWNFFKSKGLSESATAGIMGNLQQESGLRTNSVNVSSGASGIAQWMGGRLTNLKNYASSIGKSWDDLSAQLEFLWHELNGGEATTKSILNKNGGISAFNNMSVKNASELFEKAFERSGGSAQSKRNAYADEFFRKLSTGTKTVETFSNSLTTTAKTINGFSGKITSTFNDPNRSDNHRGIDIDGNTGDRIDATTRGKVIASGSASSQGYDSSYGNLVVVQDEAGLKHIYAHLENAIAKVGDTIEAGTQIGTMGSTGNSTGSHLHYEVNLNGQPVDPTQYVTNAKNGLASVGSSINDVESELVSVQSSIIQQETLIAELQRKLLDAELSVYGRRNEIIDADLSKQDARLANVNVDSEEYNKILEYQTLLLQKKQKVNQDELAHINDLIANGGLSAIALDDMKDRTVALTTEMYALDQQLQAMAFEKLDAYNEKRESPTDNIELIKSQMSMMDDDTEEYADSLNKIILSLQEIQSLNISQLADLENEIKSGKFTGEALENLQDQYEDLKVTVQNTNAEIQDTFYQQSEYVFRINDNAIDKTQDKLDFLDYQLGLLGDSDTDIKIKVSLYGEMKTGLNESIAQIDKGIEDTLAQRELAIARGDKTLDEYDTKFEEYIEQRRNQNSKLQSIYNDMQSIVENALSKVKDAESNAYSEASKAIDKALSESERRISKFSDTIDNLGRKLEVLDESDFTEKLSITSQQLSQTRSMASQIIDEYDRVASTPVYNEEQQSQVESQLKSLKSQLADANSQIIQYTKSLEQTHFESLIYGADKASKEIDRLTGKLNRNLELIEGNKQLKITYKKL